MSEKISESRILQMKKLIYILKEDMKNRGKAVKKIVVWLYLRHSPGNDQTIESQELGIENFCKQFPELEIKRKFVDIGKSGKTIMGRDGFVHMAYLARQKPKLGDLIIIWDYSRFSREFSNLKFYMTEIELNGWHIFSVKDDIPVEKGLIREIMITMIAWKNQQFLEDLIAHTMRGHRLVVEKGCQPTGRKPALGYKFEFVSLGTKKNGDERLGRKPVIDEEVKPLIIKAFEMKARQASNKVIFEEVGLLSSSGKSKWAKFFRDKRFIGEYYFHGELFENVYPEILPKKLFRQVQKVLPQKEEKKIRPSRRKGSPFFLGGVSYCFYCGAQMHGKTRTVKEKKFRYYICSNRNKNLNLCKYSGQIKADYVENSILNLFLNRVLDNAYLSRLLEWTNLELNHGGNEAELQLENIKQELTLVTKVADKYIENYLRLETDDPLVKQTVQQKMEIQVSRLKDLKIKFSKLKEIADNSKISITNEMIDAYIYEQKGRLAIKKRAEWYEFHEAFLKSEAKIIMSQDSCDLLLPFPL